jgi:hypothetical protein
MPRLFVNCLFRTTVAVFCVALLPYAGSLSLADTFGAPNTQAAPQGVAPQPQLLAPAQLENLVAPIALYPDPLLGQILAAGTYPLEIVEAQQWVAQNGNLQDGQLIEAAKQQDWDPSVQVLVGFPDALALLARDIRWTTDLGNAFLAQQADVMNAIQALRFRARNSGRLATTPQQVVTSDSRDGQSAIAIQPANPRIVYVPVYDPVYVWGSPAWGAYPALSYGYAGYGGGFGFGSGIDIGALFSGLIGWGGWGWALGWFTHTLSLVGMFFNLLGFHGFGGGFHSGYAAPSIWAHNPVHRLGVPYPSAALASRFRGTYGAAGAGLARTSAHVSATRALAARTPAPGGANSGFAASAVRPASDGWQHFGAGATPAAFGARGLQTAGARDGLPQQAFSARPAALNSFSSPQRSGGNESAHRSPYERYSAPRMSAQNFAAPRMSPPKSAHVSAPKFKAPKNAGGGHSGKSSHKH